MSFGIRIRMSALVLGSVALFLALIIGFTVATMRRFAVEDVEDFSMTILQETNTKITTFVAEIESLARSLAEYRVVQDEETAEFRDLFLSQVRARERYVRAIYLGTETGEMYEYGIGPGFIDFAPDLPDDYDPRVRPWYRSAVAAQRFTISDPYLYASAPLLGITGAIPVFSRSDPTEMTGVLGIDILLDNLRTVLWDLEIPKAGKALLLDDTGRIIASQFEPHDETRDPTAPLPIFDRELFALIAQQTSGSIQTTLNDEAVILSHTVNPATGWYVLLSLPLAEITAPTERLLTIMLALDAVLLLLLGITIRLISEHIVLGPVTRMLETVARIDAGDRDARVPVMRNDEFGVLAVRFNELVETVQLYTADMEDQVEERTREIRALEQENSRLKVTEERERIYRDLHDSLGAYLTNISICAAVAHSTTDEARRLEMLHRVDTNTHLAIESLRETVHGTPDFHNPAAVIEQIEQLVHRRLALVQVEVRFSYRCDPEVAATTIDSNMAENMFRIIQELVTNIQKHARASRATITIDHTPASLLIVVSDDGVGFAAERHRTADASGGMGLENVRFRVETCGGSVSIATGPEGTRVECQLPSGSTRDG